MTDYDKIGNRDRWPCRDQCADCGGDDDITTQLSPTEGESTAHVSGGPQGPPGPKGDTGPQGPQGVVDYPRIESYVNARIAQVFAPVNSRMDALQHDIDEKIKLTDWMEA